MNVTIFGDFCLDNINREDVQVISNELLKVSEDSVLVANLECPITNEESKRNKCGPALKSDIEMSSDALSMLPISLYTLANNHIYDYGNVGIKDTISTLEKNKISHCGAGLSVNDADKPYIIEHNGRETAILNVAEAEFCLAIHNGAGASTCKPEYILSRINDLKSKYCQLIVIIHGGNEHYHLPSPHFQKRLRFLIDAGADVVVSHHTHSASGMEVYKGKSIFYSLGNFVFKRSQMEDTWYTGHGVRLDLNNLHDFEIIPYKQGKEDNIFKLLEGNESASYISSFAEKTNIISDETKLDGEWSKYVKKRTFSYLCWLENMSRLERAVFKITGLHRTKFKSHSSKLLLQNIIQCESHHELLLDVIRRRNEKKN